jgi:hypothetical protein
MQNCAPAQEGSTTTVASGPSLGSHFGPPALSGSQRLPMPQRGPRSRTSRHTPSVGRSPYYRPSVHEGQPRSGVRMGLRSGVQASDYDSAASSPRSFTSASPLFSHRASPLSVTSGSSNGSPQIPNTIPGIAPLDSDQRPLASRFFTQPDSVVPKSKAKPKKDKAHLLCCFIDPNGTACYNQNSSQPPEVLLQILGRKAKGFAPRSEAEMLRHLWKHRSHERIHNKEFKVPEDQRTRWNDADIDAQRDLDLNHTADQQWLPGEIPPTA